MNRIRLYARLVRPEQWVKNVFVLAPLLFSRELFHPDPLTTAIKAFIGFCFVAGAVYSINDLADAAEDRSHPTKRKRPIASGMLTPSDAVLVAVVFLLAAVVVSFDLGWKYHLILSAYLLLNLLYTFKIKDVVLLDVLFIASGFMLRVLAGAYAIQVPVSSWIVLCTLFMSLVLGFGKRRAELVMSGSVGSGTNRKVLGLYSIGFLDHMLTISAAGTVITYALYTVSERTFEVFRTDNVIYTTVFVIYGVLRYLYLVHTDSTSDNPTATVTSDYPILITGFLWVLTCAVLIYST